jgi:Uma2 family endonuclease
MAKGGSGPSRRQPCDAAARRPYSSKAWYQTEEPVLTDPVLLIEILSPSNQAKTWTNIWAYTSIPSVREILVLRADRIGAELLRRSPQGEWPARPVAVSGEVMLESIGFRTNLTELYLGTRLTT